MLEGLNSGGAAPATGRRVKIRYSRKLGRCVVSTRELATIIAHAHSNLNQAVRRLLQKRPDLAREFLVGEYVAANLQRYRCYEVTALGLAGLAERLHNVPRCNDVRARLENIRVGLTVLDDRMARGEPGPSALEAEAHDMGLPAIGQAELGPRDAEIRPPDPEPQETLQLVPPVGQPARPVEAQAAPDEPPSWEINAAIETLRRTRIPPEIFAPVDGWNVERCAALTAWVYATKSPH